MDAIRAQTQRGSAAATVLTQRDVASVVRMKNDQLLQEMEDKRRNRQLLEDMLGKVGAEPITPLGIVQRLFPEESPRRLQGASNERITASGVRRRARCKVAVVYVIALSPLAAALVGGIWGYHLKMVSGWGLTGMITGSCVWLGMFANATEQMVKNMRIACSAAICDVLQYKGLVPTDGVLAIQQLQEMPDVSFLVATRADKHIVARRRAVDPLLLARHTVTGETWLVEAWALDEEAGITTIPGKATPRLES